MDLAEYNRYNNSFKHVFIYRLGGCTGFFSEYNNMVLAIHYCLVNGYRFVLESEEANFSSGIGWTEFFKPFCKEIRNKWLRRFNHRIKPSYKNRYEWFCFNLYKKIHPNYFYMYSLFSVIRAQRTDTIYTIKDVGLSGTLLENCSCIHQMIWHYNISTDKEIKYITKSIKIPEIYAGMHIRQGDKIEEAELYDVNVYMEQLQRLTDIRDIFVLTDDFLIIETLRQSFNDWHFYTLCRESEHGYSLANIINSSYSEQRASYLRLWASMDILEKSVLFVGTYSANPGMNMGFRMEPRRIKCIDFDEWQLW